MAKKANRRRSPKKPDFIEGLTVKQTKAVQALLRGASTAEAAKAAGVKRTTVSAWANHDAAFSGTLKRLKTELLDSTASVLRNEVQKSIHVLAEIRDDTTQPVGARVRAATSLIKMANLDARVEWPVPYTLDEHMAFTVLMNRWREEQDRDRRDHGQQVAQWFANSPKGKRLLDLICRCDEDERKLKELHTRLRRLSTQVANLPFAERRSAPEVAKLDEVEEAYYALLKPHQKRQEELAELREEKKALEREVIDDPTGLVRDQVKLVRLADRAGLDWVAEQLDAIGRVEGVADMLTREYERQQFAKLDQEKREYEKRINPFADEDEAEKGAEPS